MWEVAHASVSDAVLTEQASPLTQNAARPDLQLSPPATSLDSKPVDAWEEAGSSEPSYYFLTGPSDSHVFPKCEVTHTEIHTHTHIAELTSSKSMLTPFIILPPCYFQASHNVLITLMLSDIFVVRRSNLLRPEETCWFITQAD